VDKYLKSVFLIVLTIIFLFACNKETKDNHTMYFQGSEAEKLLEYSIESDNSAGIAKAIKAGANPDSQGLYGITPLILAVGKFKKNAVAELLHQGASTKLRDNEGDNAVTLAVTAYKKDPQLLKMILNAGGDSNTRFANGDPVIVRFLNDFDFNAVLFLKEAGADVNARNKSKRPLVINYAISEDWDAVWALLALGAKYDYLSETFTWQELFSAPDVHSPDSPLWIYKVKTWKFLKENGQAVPDEIEDLVGKTYWEYLKKKGLEKPMLE
jgi:hypothetical protein